MNLERLSSAGVQRHEEEAAAVELAALQRAHAKRLAAKEAVLVQGPHGWQLVKLRSLDAASRQLLLSRVYRETEDEGLGFFSRVRERLGTAGVPEATVEIRFKDLTVRGTQVVKPSGREHDSVLSKLKAFNPFHPKLRPRKWNIIDGVSGVLKPGRLTLLLGTPGSGRSVLMKALTGRLAQEKALKVTSGELTYNGESLDQFVPERTASYISQLDNHYGELTVRETLEFSARVQGGRPELLEMLEAREKELGISPDPDIQSYMAALASTGKKSVAVDIVMRTVGLDICADTLVGNNMLRGISGGQKKRVTGGEMLVGPAKVLFADEISTGLDSATTRDIMAAMRTAARYLRSTQLVALLQPAPETLELFDDIMVLSSGKIIFHGPRELVLPFFEGLGFVCPTRKGVAEFLQEVPTLGDQKRYWAGDPADYKFISAEEIAHAFYTTTEPGRAIVKELEGPYSGKSDNNPALVKTRFGATPVEMARSCLRRGLWLLGSQKEMHIGRLVQTIILAFVVGTMFLKTDKGITDGDVQGALSAANNMLGVLFFTCINFMVSAFPDSAMMVESLPVWYKQRGANFYPASCFALQAVMMRLPWVFAESWVWTLMVYFMVGFVTSARLLAFWAITFSVGCFSLTLFLTSGALMRRVPSANALQATFLLLFINTCGFVLNKAQIPGGWNGVYWANPMQWFLSGMASNELTSPDWSQEVSAGGQSIGTLALDIRGFRHSYDNVWVAIFAWGFGACAVNIAALIFCLARLEGPKNAMIVSEEAYALQHRSRTGNNLKAMGRGHVNPDASVAPATGKGSPASSAVVDLEAQATGSGGAVVAATTSGSTLPFKPLCLTFRDVMYSVPFPKGAPRDDSNTGEEPHADQLVLLKGITGSFRPGILTALMGASGAGKTTLMDVLADRKTGGVITGDIQVNGYPKEHHTFARVMGYCEQTDIHVPHTTVHEALQLSARLRLPTRVNKATTEAFVLEIMDLIELTPIKDSMVGLPGSGLSVEQRKRLTIAVELVANPSIVFMDEPTSGLDARGAALVMKAVKSTVATGRTVVCTIHQPSLEIFEVFSELLLLKRGGEVVFNGPIGQDATHLLSYFSSISGTPAIQPRINPANWMLEVTSPDAEKHSGHNFAEVFKTSELAEAASAMVDKYGQPTEGDAPLRMEDLRTASQLRQTLELLRRNSREMLRDTSYNGIRSLIVLVVAICFATLFANQGQKVDTYGGILNVAGAMYSASIFLSVSFFFMVQDILVVRRTVFYREHAAGTYSVVPFWAAELLAELPWLLVNALVYSIIVYFSIGFVADAGKFFWFFMSVFLCLVGFISFGMMSVHMTPSLEISNAFSAFAFALVNLTCGFMLPKPAIPAGWIWLYYLNPASYALYGLVANQLGDVTTLSQMPDGGVVPVNEFIEDYFGFKHSFMGWTVLIQLAFIVFFRAVALLCLKKLNFQSR